MTIAAFLSSALLVGASAAPASVARQGRFRHKMLSMAMWMVLIVAPLQAFVGDMHGLNTSNISPRKSPPLKDIGRIRGEATPLILFGLPDMEQERTRYAVEIPALGSLILTHSLNEQVPALKSFPKAERPNSTLVFWSFRLMVGMGVLMIVLGLAALWLRYQRRLYHARPFLSFCAVDGASRSGGDPRRVGDHRSGEATGRLWTAAHRVCAQHAANEPESAAVLLWSTARYSAWLQLYAAADQKAASDRRAPEDGRPARPLSATGGTVTGRGGSLMGIDLSLIWFVIIVFATLMYIVMDGFDLGIGILFPAIQDPLERDIMVNSVAPVWDGNETGWSGGAGLFGAFPLAYAVIADARRFLSHLLIGLIFRGVAFEFRFKATPVHKSFWDWLFSSRAPARHVYTRIVVGAVINGFPVSERTFSGGALDWFTPFNLFCGIRLVVAYAMLGSTGWS